MRNVVEFGVEVGNATVQVAALIGIIESTFMQFPIEDINNLDCWLATIPAPSLDAQGVRMGGSEVTMALQELKIVMEYIKLQIECVSCSSPKFEDLADLMSSEDAVEDLTRLANDAIDYVSSLLGGTFLQVQLDRMLVDAPKRCPHSAEFVRVDASKTEYQDFDQIKTASSIDFMIIIGSVIASLVLLATTSVIVVKLAKMRRHSRWIASLKDDEILHYKKKQLEENERLMRLDSETTSMFKSPVIPCYIRFAVPLVVIANIGFFLSGHISLGASVDLTAQIGGESVKIKGM